MSRLGNLTKDEKARYAALTFRMCEHDHWDVSMCDCPSDCEYVQETEAEVRSVVKKIWEECEMTESAKWVFVPEVLGPPPPLVFIDECRNRRAVIQRSGFVHVIATDCGSSYGDDIIVRSDDLRGLIASLQSILVLAEEHFGEEWGKE